MEMVQIKGVDSSVRDTKAHLAAGAKLIVTERLLTHGNHLLGVVHRYNRWLVHDDFAFVHDDGVGSTEVYCYFFCE